jgi:transcription termination factor Rho
MAPWNDGEPDKRVSRGIKGTSNSGLILELRGANKRAFLARDLTRSGTRMEEVRKIVKGDQMRIIR